RQASGGGRSVCARRPAAAIRRRGEGDGVSLAERRHQDRPSDRSVEVIMHGEERRSSGPYVFAGLFITALLHFGVIAVLWMQRARSESSPPLGPGQFIDAALVKFGRPRDLSFLPHKQGVKKTEGPLEAIKVATDANALPKPPKNDDPPEKIDPLKRTHAD